MLSDMLYDVALPCHISHNLVLIIGKYNTIESIYIYIYYYQRYKKIVQFYMNI